MGGRTSRWLLLLIAMAASFCATLAAAQTRSGLPLATCFRPAEPGLTPRMLFAHPDGFDCRRAQSGSPNGDYWVLSAPLPAVLPFMASVRTASVRVFLYHEVGARRNQPGHLLASPGLLDHCSPEQDLDHRNCVELHHLLL